MREATPLPAAQLRFHLHRLGNRRDVASLFGAKLDRVCAALPVENIDRLYAGELVLIGRVLAKRCASCGVTRELEHFNAKSATTGGCGAQCDQCRKR